MHDAAFTDASAITSVSSSPKNVVEQPSSTSEKNSRRKSKLKKLLGSPNRKNSPPTQQDTMMMMMMMGGGEDNCYTSSLKKKGSYLDDQTESSIMGWRESGGLIQRRKLVKIITPTAIKLAPLPSDGTFESLRDLLASRGSMSMMNFSIFYRDRQRDTLILESSSDFELACEDWFECGHSEGALPLVLKTD